MQRRGLPPSLFHGSPQYHLDDALWLLGATNIIDAISSALFVFFALVMLAHRLFWPFLSRTVFALKDMGVLKWRKVIGAGGVALVVFAIGGAELWKVVIEKTIEKFF